MENTDRSTSFARMWKVTRRDQMVLGFTDHDRDIKFDGVTYLARGGFIISESEVKLGLSSDNAEIQGAISHNMITKEDIGFGLYHGAYVESFAYDWRKEERGDVFFFAEIAAINYSENRFKAELHSPFGKLNQIFGRGFHESCDAQLGDQRCGVNLEDADFYKESKILDVKAKQLIIKGVDLPAGSFEKGKLTYLDAPAAIASLSIRSDQIQGEKRVIEFWEKAGFQFEVGKKVRLYIGCDKSLACCKAKFGNALNFRGFPHIPGEGWLYHEPKEKSASRLQYGVKFPWQ